MRKVKKRRRTAIGSAVSSKGQVTVPQAVRYALNLRPGDHVMIVADGDRAIMRPVRSDFFSLKGSLHDPRRRPMTPSEMREAAKDYVLRRYREHRHG